VTPERQQTRRAVLRAGAGLAATATLAGCAGGGGDAGDGNTTTTTSGETSDPETTGDTESAPADSTPDAVGTEFVAGGFANPLGVEFPPGDSDDPHVVDQAGLVYVASSDGVRDEPFLDVRDRMVDLSGYEERGLLGLAFHPEFGADDDRVFVRYSAPATDATPDGYSHTFVLSSFRVTDGSVAPDSERRLLELPQPQANHNAGSVAFGPDGHLYVGTGDGGGANDTGTGHVDDWYDANDGGNGQDVTENRLGSILRIDVDTDDDDRPYGIPEDNPLVGEAGFDEQYAWGFRNPWRFSFADGDLYVADVGQNRFEEVSVVEAGGNYGWNVREGAHCFDAADPGNPPDDCPSETPDGEPLEGPIVEYSHGTGELTGVSVIGGYRYDGDGIPGLRGDYVFGDWQADGRLFLAHPPDSEGDTETGATGLWETSTVDVAASDGDDGPGQYLLAFGRDADGALYVATTDSGTPTGDSGAVHRLVPAE
jgi:glucose/arabinose dehydrogenase